MVPTNTEGRFVCLFAVILATALTFKKCPEVIMKCEEAVAGSKNLERILDVNRIDGGEKPATS
jgi:hypothetical protein